MTPLQERITRLDAATEGAWMKGSFASWTACIKLLIDRGYNDQEIEAIMRSKWMRWASDGAKNWRKPATAGDLQRFLDNPRNECTRAEVTALVYETFHG